MVTPTLTRASRFGAGLRALIGVLALALAGRAVAGTGRASQSAALNAELAEAVRGYDNGGTALIPTLIEVAAAYRIPMGIEKVTPEALRTPVRIALREGTVADLLSACVRQLPNYRWAARDGAVDIYGERELKSRDNLFNFVVPSFEIKGGTLNDVNFRLRRLTPNGATAVRSQAHGAGPGEVGLAGDTPGDGELEGAHVDFVAQRATVRSVLNRIVALSEGKAIWIARVPPSGLSQAPRAGLWQLGPASLSIIATLEPSLTESLGRQ
jgi:hypothetical protein